MRTLTVALLLSIAVTPAMAGESAGLMLPPGFHATVVADALGAGTRHVVVRPMATFMFPPARAGTSPNPPV